MESPLWTKAINPKIQFHSASVLTLPHFRFQCSHSSDALVDARVFGKGGDLLVHQTCMMDLAFQCFNLRVCHPQLLGGSYHLHLHFLKCLQTHSHYHKAHQQEINLVVTKWIYFNLWPGLISAQ